MIRYIQKKYLSGGCDRAYGRRRAGLLISLTGIGLNLLLFIIKYAAGVISGSIAVTADGFNNLADTGACLMVLLGLSLGNRKPCRRFPFGYGRIEYLSGLLVAALVLVLGARMTASSVEKILHPESVEGSPVVIAALILSIAVKSYMYRYNKRIGELIDSAGMKAAAVDALSDCIATFAIIAAIIVEKLSGLSIDGCTGALVALCILWAGLSAAKESMGPLLGRGISEDLKERIEVIARRHRNIMEVHGIALHDYGPQKKLLTMYLSVTGGAEHTVRELREEIRTELHTDAVIGIGDREIGTGSAHEITQSNPSEHRINPPKAVKNSNGQS